MDTKCKNCRSIIRECMREVGKEQIGFSFENCQNNEVVCLLI